MNSSAMEEAMADVRRTEEALLADARAKQIEDALASSAMDYAQAFTDPGLEPSATASDDGSFCAPLRAGPCGGE
jgi:hypothetical protein